MVRKRELSNKDDTEEVGIKTVNTKKPKQNIDSLDLEGTGGDHDDEHDVEDGVDELQLALY